MCVNMCVHSSGGISFYNSMEESVISHTRQFSFKWVDKCIEEIGAQFVVHVLQIFLGEHGSKRSLE